MNLSLVSGLIRWCSFFFSGILGGRRLCSRVLSWLLWVCSILFMVFWL